MHGILKTPGAEETLKVCEQTPPWVSSLWWDCRRKRKGMQRKEENKKFNITQKNILLSCCISFCRGLFSILNNVINIQLRKVSETWLFCSVVKVVGQTYRSMDRHPACVSWALPDDTIQDTMLAYTSKSHVDMWEVCTHSAHDLHCTWVREQTWLRRMRVEKECERIKQGWKLTNKM